MRTTSTAARGIDGRRVKERSVGELRITGFVGNIQWETRILIRDADNSRGGYISGNESGIEIRLSEAKLASLFLYGKHVEFILGICLIPTWV